MIWPEALIGFVSYQALLLGSVGLSPGEEDYTTIFKKNCFVQRVYILNLKLLLVEYHFLNAALEFPHKKLEQEGHKTEHCINLWHNVPMPGSYEENYKG